MKQRTTGKIQFLVFRRFLLAFTKFFILGGKLWQSVRQLENIIFISNNHASFHLWWKENLVEHRKFSKYYDHDCRSNIFLCCVILKKFWWPSRYLHCSFWYTVKWQEKIGQIKDLFTRFEVTVKEWLLKNYYFEICQQFVKQILNRYYYWIFFVDKIEVTFCLKSFEYYNMIMWNMKINIAE